MAGSPGRPGSWSADLDQRRRRERGLEALRQVSLEPASPLAAFATAWLEAMPNGNSAETYGRAVARWLRWCGEHGVDPLAARVLNGRAYLASLSYLASTTRGAHCAIGRAFYDAAVDEGLTVRNPFRGVRPNQVRPRDPTPALTLEEFERTLALIERDAVDPDRALVAWRDYSIVYLAGRVGLRRQELRDLTWLALGRHGGETLLRVHGKGDKWADVVLPADVAGVLLRWRATCEAALGRPCSTRDAVFPVLGRRACFHVTPSGDVAALCPRSVSRLVEGRLLDAGIDAPRAAAHALRATAATIAYEHGADPLRIQTMLRHAQLSTTGMYIRRLEESRGSAATSWAPSVPAPVGGAVHVLPATVGWAGSALSRGVHVMGDG